MRTTVKLSDEQHDRLHILAAQKGCRGYSSLIQEALDLYLKDQVSQDVAVKSVLDMRGSWKSDEGERVRTTVRKLRDQWKIDR